MKIRQLPSITSTILLIWKNVSMVYEWWRRLPSQKILPISADVIKKPWRNCLTWVSMLMSISYQSIQMIPSSWSSFVKILLSQFGIIMVVAMLVKLLALNIKSSELGDFALLMVRYSLILRALILKPQLWWWAGKITIFSSVFLFWLLKFWHSCL